MNISCSALITNYNTWDLTTLCAQELERWSKENLKEILVVDDASEQNIPKNLPASVQVIRNSENRGYVASVNIGFAQLQGDIIILLDSDAYPLMDLIPLITQAFATNSKLGSIGFQPVDEQGQPTGSCSPEPNAIGLLYGQKLEALSRSWFKLTENLPLCLHSCGMAVRRSAFEEIGGFDEEFDFLDADIDFSMRLRNSGWDIQVDSRLLAYHKGGGSLQTTSKRVLRHHKNRWLLLAKHKRLPLACLLKAGLVTRHFFEYACLRIAGKLLIKNSSILKDKLHGRRQLLSKVWSGYGNEF